MSDADQEIRFRLVVESQQSTTEINKQRVIINALKDDLRALVAQSIKNNEAFNSMGERVSAAFKIEKSAIQESIRLWKDYQAQQNAVNTSTKLDKKGNKEDV